jgi:hypothetical protein
MESNQDRPILNYPIPPVDLPEEDIAYIAGLLDFEGSFLIYKLSGRRSYCLQVAYRKTDYDTLKYVGDAFGGRVRPAKSDPKSKLNIWLLLLTSKKAYYALKHIYPFLIIKKRAAKVCIDFFELYWRPYSGGIPVSDERQQIGRIYVASLDKYKTKPLHRQR